MSQGDSQDAPGPTGGWRRLGAPAAVALAGLMAARPRATSISMSSNKRVVLYFVYVLRS